MANTVIALKKSSVPTAQPTVLANGELAINYADGKLFYKHANGTILPFNTQGGNAFGTINANGTLVVAGSSEAVVTLVAGNNVTITGDAINDKITISATGGGDSTISSLAFDKANAANIVASSAFDKANAANVLAFNTGIGANAYAASIANTIAIAAFDKANTGGGGSGSLTTYSANVGNGAANTYNVSHNLNSYSLLMTMRENSTGYIIYPDLQQTTSNNLVISFVDNPTANQYALLIAKVT